MFCMVCGLVFEQANFKFCADCGKLMCLSCMNEHAVYYKNSKERHKEENISHLKRFFEVEASLDKGKCRNKHDKNADYFCKKCKRFTCAACLSLYHQHGKNNKVEHFTAQIQDALIGCENMLEAKETELQTILEKLKRKEMDLQRQKRKSDQLILQTTKKLWYQIATALRKREKSIRTRCKLKFEADETRIKNQAENANYFLGILRNAKATVEKFNQSCTVPLQKEIFSNLSLLNRINTAPFDVRQKAGNDSAFPQFHYPKDADIQEACNTMLVLEENQTFLETENLQESNQKFQTDGLGSLRDDDLFSFGETDEDFGEYFVIGVPQMKGRPTTAQQVIKGPLRHDHVGGLNREEKARNREKEKAHPKIKSSMPSKANPTDKSKYYQEEVLSVQKNHKKEKHYSSKNHVTFEQPIPIKHSKYHKHKNSYSVKSNSQANLHRDTERDPHDAIASELRSYSTGNLHSTLETTTEKHGLYSTVSKHITSSSTTPKVQNGSSYSKKENVPTKTTRNTVNPYKLSNPEIFSQTRVLNRPSHRISTKPHQQYVQQSYHFKEKIVADETRAEHPHNHNNDFPNKSKKQKFARPKFLLRTAQDQLFLNSRVLSTAL